MERSEKETTSKEKKKVVIAGGRDFNDFDYLYESVATILKEFHWYNWKHEVVIISGTARGADKLGEKFAHTAGIEVEKYPANWDKHGKSAGYKRNLEMAEASDVLIAFWDGKSKGTKHMIDIALAKGLEVHIFRYNNDTSGYIPDQKKWTGVMRTNGE